MTVKIGEGLPWWTFNDGTVALARAGGLAPRRWFFIRKTEQQWAHGEAPICVSRHMQCAVMLRQVNFAERLFTIEDMLHHNMPWSDFSLRSQMSMRQEPYALLFSGVRMWAE